MNTETLSVTNSLSCLLCSIDDVQQMNLVLRMILSDKELLSICNRLKILHLLEAGFSQREISRRLGVGIGTVTRGASVHKVKNCVAIRDITKIISTDKIFEKL